MFNKQKKQTEKTPALTPEQKAQRRKKLRRVSVSAGSLAVTLVAVILVNLIATSLTDKFDLNLDLTSNQLYQISDDTKSALSDLKDSVTITVLADEDDFKKDTYYGTVYKLLNKYTQLAGDNLTVTYINPYTNPNAVSKYSNLASSITTGSVIVSCGDNTRVLNTSDFYSTEASSSYSGYYDVTGFQGEQALTSAILSVTSEETPGMYVLQGHNESISTSLSTLFTSAGYTAN